MPTSLLPHHLGFVVPNLDAAIDWSETALALRLLVREPDTDVDGEAFGLPGQAVRLRGALMAPALPDITQVDLAYEFHELELPSDGAYRRRAHDYGLGHFALASQDIVADMNALASLGVTWYRAAPLTIHTGPYCGRRWVYGWAPVLQAVIELLQDAREAL